MCIENDHFWDAFDIVFIGHPFSAIVLIPVFVNVNLNKKKEKGINEKDFCLTPRLPLSVSTVSSPLNLDIAVVCYVAAPQVAGDRQYLNLCALSIGKPYKELWHRSYNGRITKKERDASFKSEGANFY